MYVMVLCLAFPDQQKQKRRQILYHQPKDPNGKTASNHSSLQWFLSFGPAADQSQASQLFGMHHNANLPSRGWWM